MINFKDPYLLEPVERMNAIWFLYRLLEQRPAAANISHLALPSIEQHGAFFESRPYRYWYLITEAHEGGWLGAIYATHRNELGIAIDNAYQRKGYALDALRIFIKTHRPLPAEPARRNGNWLANVAMENDPSHNLFHRLGKPIQVTYEIAPCA